MTAKDHKTGGLVLELRVGEKVVLTGFGNSVDSDSVSLILEFKAGRTARLRFQAPPTVKVGKPEKTLA
jgi:hypothetical protein